MPGKCPWKAEDTSNWQCCQQIPKKVLRTTDRTFQTYLMQGIWKKKIPFKGRPIHGKKVLPEKAGMAVLVAQKKKNEKK